MAEAPQPADAALKIKRLSTHYVPAQDRFRISAEMEDGAVQAMWLTQRLLRLTLTPLGQYFDKTPPPTLEQKARGSYAELMHKVRGKGGPPMGSLEVSREWLVGTIDIRMGQPLRLVFRGEAGEAAQMELDPLKLRKWLAIIHQKTLKAGWPETLWPASIVAALD